MKMPPAISEMFARFDRMSARERLLVTGATLVATVMLWTLAFMDPTSAQQRALNAELITLQESMAAAAKSMQASVTDDPTLLAQRQEEQLQKQLATIDAQLASKSAGLIAPERMVQVIHDVLSRQHGVTLISLHNAPVASLVPPTAQPPASSAGPVSPAGTAGPVSAASPASFAGPYIQPVEIVVEGSYLDVLAYLRALENLEWRFYWRLLELETTAYPVNRVRIELSTLSLDKDWIGI
jgi:MSHA biogenesis protein MshJ